MLPICPRRAFKGVGSRKMSDLGVLVEQARPLPDPGQLTPGLTTGEKVFRFVAAFAAASVLAILGLVALFLIMDAAPALKVAGFKFLTTYEWNPDGTPAHFGIAALVYGTAMIAFIALVVALPVAIGSAPVVHAYSPPPPRRPLGALPDLLAA